MDTNIEKRAFPLPYPESPSVADWHAQHAPAPQHAAPAEPVTA
jgi:hypothetical protein